MTYYYLKLNEELLREILFECIVDYTDIADYSATVGFEYFFDSDRSLFIKSISIFDDDSEPSEKIYDSWINDKYPVDEIKDLCRKNGLNFSVTHFNEEIIKKLILKRLSEFKNGVPRKYYKEASVEFFGEVDCDFTCVIVTSKEKIRQDICGYINDNHDFSKRLKFKKSEEK